MTEVVRRCGESSLSFYIAGNASHAKKKFEDQPQLPGQRPSAQNDIRENRVCDHRHPAGDGGHARGSTDTRIRAARRRLLPSRGARGEVRRHLDGHEPDDDHRAPGGVRRARAVVLPRRAALEAAPQAGERQGQGDPHPRAVPFRGRPRRADRLLPGATHSAADRRTGSRDVRREPGPARGFARRPRKGRRHRARLLLLLLEGLRRRHARPRRRVRGDAARRGPTPGLPGVPVGARLDACHRQGPRHPVVRQHARRGRGDEPSRAHPRRGRQARVLHRPQRRRPLHARAST